MIRSNLLRTQTNRTHMSLLLEHGHAAVQFLETLLLRRADGLLVITQDRHFPIGSVVKSHLPDIMPSMVKSLSSFGMETLSKGQLLHEMRTTVTDTSAMRQCLHATLVIAKVSCVSFFFPL